MCRGPYFVASVAAVSSVADTDAAAANNATTIPATGIVLVSMLLIVSKGFLRNDWLTSRVTISASPTASGSSVIVDTNGCVSSSDAPKNARPAPTAASPIAQGSF